DRQHARVDVEEDARLDRLERAVESLVGETYLERGECLRVELRERAIDRVEARHDTTREVHEERIGRELFESEDSVRLGSINRPHAPAPGRVALHNPQFSEVRREEQPAAATAG